MSKHMASNCRIIRVKMDGEGQLQLRPLLHNKTPKLLRVVGAVTRAPTADREARTFLGEEKAGDE